MLTNPGTLLSAAALTAAVVLTPLAAQANFSALYDARFCHGNSRDDDAGFNRLSDRITNNTANPKTIHCPIVKRTSGPGITNDTFMSVDALVATPGPAVQCRIEVWKTAIPSIQLNRVDMLSGAALNGNHIFIAPGHFTVSNYWDAGAAPTNPPSWYWIDFSCQLPSGASLYDYTVTEAGNLTQNRIFPAVNCAADPSNDSPWLYIEEPKSLTQPAGMIRGNAGPSKFAMNCPIPTSRQLDFAVAHPIGGQVLGCNIDSQNFSSFTWRSSVSTNGGAWPSEVLPRSGFPKIVSPALDIASGVSHNLACGVNSDLGDGQLLSYRSQPLPSRTSWGVQASVGGGADFAKDGDGTTRWTTGARGLAGNWFRIDLGSSKTFRQIVLDAGNSNDFPRNFEVHVSSDNVNWGSAVYTGTGSTSLVYAYFSSSRTARYVRVRLTADMPGTQWWSIHEVHVLP